jgi:hypothetical protein
MDVEQLHVVLQQSFSPEAAIRKPAEDIIRNLKNLPGSVVLLLQVAVEKQVRACVHIVPRPGGGRRHVPFALTLHAKRGKLTTICTFLGLPRIGSL